MFSALEVRLLNALLSKAESDVKFPSRMAEVKLKYCVHPRAVWVPFGTNGVDLGVIEK
jgi:hypothetical protein